MDAGLARGATLRLIRENVRGAKNLTRSLFMGPESEALFDYLEYRRVVARAAANKKLENLAARIRALFPWIVALQIFPRGEAEHVGLVACYLMSAGLAESLDDSFTAMAAGIVAPKTYVGAFNRALPVSFTGHALGRIFVRSPDEASARASLASFITNALVLSALQGVPRGEAYPMAVPCAGGLVFGYLARCLSASAEIEQRLAMLVDRRRHAPAIFHPWDITQAHACYFARTFSPTHGLKPDRRRSFDRLSAVLEGAAVEGRKIAKMFLMPELSRAGEKLRLDSPIPAAEIAGLRGRVNAALDADDRAAMFRAPQESEFVDQNDPTQLEQPISLEGLVELESRHGLFVPDTRPEAGHAPVEADAFFGYLPRAEAGAWGQVGLRGLAAALAHQREVERAKKELEP
ncbi:MAG: hypothetical protein ACXWF2_17795 [Usitatibacter sp.]